MSTRRSFLKHTAAAGSAAAAFPLVGGAQPKPVRIGVLHPVTGALAYSGQQCREGALMAIEEGVDAVGVSILSGAHMVLLPRLRALLDENGGEKILLIAGGVIPQEDIPALTEAGVQRVFLSGTPISEIVDYLSEALT